MQLCVQIKVIIIISSSIFIIILNSGQLSKIFGLSPTMVFVKIGQSKRTNRQLYTNRFPEIYLGGKKILKSDQKVNP